MYLIKGQGKGQSDRYTRPRNDRGYQRYISRRFKIDMTRWCISGIPFATLASGGSDPKNKLRGRSLVKMLAVLGGPTNDGAVDCQPCRDIALAFELIKGV
jgi:hypothetical protein